MRILLQLINLELRYPAFSSVFKPSADALKSFFVFVKPGFRGGYNVYHCLKPDKLLDLNNRSHLMALTISYILLNPNEVSPALYRCGHAAPPVYLRILYQI